MSAWDEVRAAVDEFAKESDVIECSAMRARVNELELLAADRERAETADMLEAIADELHYANELKRWELEFRRDTYLGKSFELERRPLPERMCVESAPTLPAARHEEGGL